MSNEVLTGAQAVIRSLELLGVDTVFGLPGGAILPTYDPLMDSKIIRHILVRHEQGAGHAAEGYASSSGKLGVCIATSGPGATNLVTAIADAHMDSVPLTPFALAKNWALCDKPNQYPRNKPAPRSEYADAFDPDYQQYPTNNTTTK